MKAWRISLILSVLLLVSALFYHQRREKEFDSKSHELSKLEADPGRPGRRSHADREPPRSGTASSTSNRIAELRRLASEPLFAETISTILAQKSDVYAVETWHELFFMFMNRDPAEIAAFLAEIKLTDFKHTSRIESDLARLFPDSGPFESRMQTALQQKSKDYSRLFQDWLAAEPDAAREWIDRQLKSGSINGKGLNDDPLSHMLSLLVGRLALESPKEMMTYYNQIPDGQKYRANTYIAGQIVQGGPETVKTFFAASANDATRESVIGQMVAAQRVDDLSKEEIFSTSQTLDLTPAETTSVIQKIVTNSSFYDDETFQSGLEWIRENTGRQDLEGFHNSLVRGAYSEHREEAELWAEDIPKGNAKDATYRSFTEMAAYSTTNLERAAGYFTKINSKEIRKHLYNQISLPNYGFSVEEFDKHLTKNGIDPNSLKQE